MKAFFIFEQYAGKSLRFIYATGAYSPSYQQHKIIKFDMKTRKEIIWKGSETQHVGEPMFVANPNGTGEDDGVVVVVVVNYFGRKKGEKDFIVFLVC